MIATVCVCARARPRASVLQIHMCIHMNLKQDCSLFVCEALAHDSECLRQLVLIDTTYARCSQTCGHAHHRPQCMHMMSEPTHASEDHPCIPAQCDLQAHACMQTNTLITHARRDRRPRAHTHVTQTMHRCRLCQTWRRPGQWLAADRAAASPRRTPT